jgi:hypothetical protein
MKAVKVFLSTLNSKMFFIFVCLISIFMPISSSGGKSHLRFLIKLGVFTGKLLEIVNPELIAFCFIFS